MFIPAISLEMDSCGGKLAQLAHVICHNECNSWHCWVSQWGFIKERHPGLESCFIMTYTNNMDRQPIERCHMNDSHCGDEMAEIILGMVPLNERWRYFVTSSLIHWAHTQNDNWMATGLRRGVTTLFVLQQQSFHVMDMVLFLFHEQNCEPFPTIILYPQSYILYLLDIPITESMS